MAEERFGREYGAGTFLGDSGGVFIKQSLKEQVLAMGWSHACPIVDKVAQEFGADWTLKRYAECNFVFGLVCETAKKVNPELYKQLTSPVTRLKDENPGVNRFNPNLVPTSFYKEMSPLSTPWGYAIPRVVIEEMGRGENNKDRNSVRILKALDLVDRMVRSSKGPIELLVKLSEAVSNSEANPKAVLSHALSAAVFREEGCKTIFENIKDRIDRTAPVLSKTYNSMSDVERAENDIINFK